MKKSISTLFWISCTLLLTNCGIPKTPVELPKLLRGNMVLQRDVPVHLWGKCKPGERIVVQFQGSTFRTRTNRNGEWDITLDSYPAGGPYNLTINRDTLKNVFVGDVWVCSGQSNMEWPLLESSSAEGTLKRSGNSRVRLYQVKNTVSQTELDDAPTHFGWQESRPETLAGFSAVGYLFARELAKTTKVPIGVISADWGGSPIEVWMSKDILSEEERAKQPQRDSAFDAYQEELKIWNEKVDLADSIFIGSKDIHAQYIRDVEWDTIMMPNYWEKTVYPNFDGIVYLRREFILDLYPSYGSIMLGCIDDIDEVYINGKKIGSGEGFNSVRGYTIPKGVMMNGLNVLVVRVKDNGGNGGIRPLKGLMFLTYNEKKMSLEGEWKCKASLPLKDIPEKPKGNIWENTYLYNAMIAPLTKLPIKGVIWYQGESNVWNAENYEEKFTRMVADWRQKWNLGDFPFLYVQLANFKVEGEGDKKWAELREAQRKCLKIPNTGMAVTIDIGEEDNIHPVNKIDVAKRLRLAAQKIAYGEDIVSSGPIYEKYRISGNLVLVSFTNIGNGLKSSDGQPLRNFEISDQNGNWYPAEATIERDVVVVRSPQVTQPTGVRYAWESAPRNINFYNAEGLPASPFTTE